MVGTCPCPETRTMSSSCLVSLSHIHVGRIKDNQHHRSEECPPVAMKFRLTVLVGVQGDEVTDTRVQRAPNKGPTERFDLSCNPGQDFNIEPVKLVETVQPVSLRPLKNTPTALYHQLDAEQQKVERDNRTLVF